MHLFALRAEAEMRTGSAVPENGAVLRVGPDVLVASISTRDGSWTLTVPPLLTMSTCKPQA